VYSIACASVVAKVVRDRMMSRVAVRYPEYGWERNQGYATREHRDAIRAHGLTPHHRASWQALQTLLAGDQLSLFDVGEEGAGRTNDGIALPEDVLAGQGIPDDAVAVMAPIDEADERASEAFAATG